MTEHSASTEPVRRIEVFTGSGRRRTWSAEDKAKIIAESLTSGASVCSVARRHGLSPQQLFGWRRNAREATAKTEPLFVPAVVETSPAPPAADPATVKLSSSRKRRERPASQAPSAAAIELEIGGVTVRIGREAQTGTIEAVIRALKAVA
jgi:transposase